MLKTLFYQKGEVFYDGSQLSPGWIESKFNLKGDSLVSFIGGCEIKFEYMVDLEDLKKRNLICSDSMLHFIGEFYSSSELYFSFALQRIFVLLTEEIIEGISQEEVIREGDDLFLIQKEKKLKLSISIATVSPISSLFHFALNLTKRGAPIKVATLKDLGIKVTQFAPLVLKKFSKEYEDILNESQKVRRLN